MDVILMNSIPKSAFSSYKPLVLAAKLLFVDTS